MANKNITDLPGGAFAAGHKFEMFNTVANQNQSVTIPAQTVQTQNLIDATLAGNTSGVLALISSGTMTLAGGNNVTLSQAGNAVTISAASQTVQTQNLHNVTLSGNTAGVLAAISSGTMTLAGGNNITLSQAGNAVTISGPNTAAQSVQTQNLIDATLAGNTSGALALISSGTMTLAGGNNVTLSQAGNAVTISAASQSVQTQNCVDATLAGNTSGALALISSGTMTLAGGNNITLSQAGNAVTISAAAGAAPTISFWENMDLDGTAGAVLGSQVITYDTVAFFPLRREGVFPGNMTPATIAMLFTLSGSTATMSQAFSSSLFIGVYTFNASTLSLLNSVVTTWGSGADNANLSTIRAGGRWLTIHSSLWSAAPAFSQGNYWIGTLIRSSSRSDQTAGFYGQGPWQVNSPLSGTIGVSQVNATTVGYLPFFGRMSVSSASLPASIGSADLNKQVVLGSNIPLLRFNNLIASY